MSRPKPKILLSHVDQKSYKAEQVLEADGIYAVFYQGKPINVRSLNSLINSPIKYKKSSFSNAGHSFNLCEKLNTLFKTDQFTVVLLTQGQTVIEKDIK